MGILNQSDVNPSRRIRTLDMKSLPYVKVFTYGCLLQVASGIVNRLVNTSKFVKYFQLQIANFVHEIVLIREGILELPNRASLSRLELDLLVHVVSTS